MKTFNDLRFIPTDTGNPKILMYRAEIILKYDRKCIVFYYEIPLARVRPLELEYSLMCYDLNVGVRSLPQHQINDIMHELQLLNPKTDRLTR